MSHLLPLVTLTESPPSRRVTPPPIQPVCHIGSAASLREFDKLLGLDAADATSHVVAARAFSEGSLELDVEGGELRPSTICFWPPGKKAFANAAGFGLGYKGEDGHEALFAFLRRTAKRLEQTPLTTLLDVVQADPGKTVEVPAIVAPSSGGTDVEVSVIPPGPDIFWEGPAVAGPPVIGAEPRPPGPDVYYETSDASRGENSDVLATFSPNFCESEERIHLINMCNLRCKYCGDQSGPEVTWDGIERLFAEMQRKHPSGLSRTRLLITGGEPTLSPLLPQVLRRGRELGFAQIMMTSHGVKFSDPAYADLLLESGLSHVELSLRSFKEEAYDAITGTKGKFGRALKGVQNILSRFEVFANFVMNQHNYTELPGALERLTELHAGSSKHLHVLPSVVIIERKPFDEAERATWREISAPNSILLPYLAEAVRWDHRQERRLLTPQFDSLCCAPMCAARNFPEVLEHAPGPPRPGRGGHDSRPVVYLDPDRDEIPRIGRVKANSCRTCRYDTRCVGIAPGNADLYGFADLVPIPPDARR